MSPGAQFLQHLHAAVKVPWVLGEKCVLLVSHGCFWVVGPTLVMGWANVHTWDGGDAAPHTCKTDKIRVANGCVPAGRGGAKYARCSRGCKEDCGNNQSRSNIHGFFCGDARRSRQRLGLLVCFDFRVQILVHRAQNHDEKSSSNVVRRREKIAGRAVKYVWSIALRTRAKNPGGCMSPLH